MNIYTMFGILGLIVAVLFICLFLYLLWLLLITSLDIFVNNRLVEINNQKDRLWLAVEDLYEATDDLKERTWDWVDNRKQVKKLTKELSELEEYVLNDDDDDSKLIFAKAVINKQHFSYKGYTGSIDFSMEDMYLFGKVQMIQDLIMYDGETLEELKLSFESAVDEYLEMCD